MNKIKEFDIVIINWNSGTQLKECITSIYNSRKTNCDLNKIVVVDNASSDKSIEILNQDIQNLKLIYNNENLGFGKACNQGAKECSSEFILFLNPDMLVYEDTFLKLFEYIEKVSNPEVAVYGVQLLNANGNIQKSCATFPTLWNFFVRSSGLNKINQQLFKPYIMEYWNHQESRAVNHVIGAFYLIQRDIFTHLGGFDERYFVYSEDLDLSKRVKDLGYKSFYFTGAQAYHKGGGTSDQVKAKRLFYNLRSRIIYAFKHLGMFKGFLTLLITLLIEPVSRTFFLLMKGNFKELLESLKGFSMLYLDVINIIKLGLKK